MTCKTAENFAVGSKVSCAPILLSGSELQAWLEPAPLGLKTEVVKSAWSSLECTMPRVPKPAKENGEAVESAAGAAAAASAAGLPSRAQSPMAMTMRTTALQRRGAGIEGVIRLGIARLWVAGRV